MSEQKLEESIAVVGGGNMAEALVGGWLRRGLVEPGQVVVGEPREDRRALWWDKYGVRGVADNREAIQGADACLLSVKPQLMRTVLEGLAGGAPPCLWISIAAGVPIRFLMAQMGREGRYVRVMPNTPALVGAGVSAMCGGGAASPEDLALVERLLGAVGAVVEVSEAQMDAVTAVSGSGPAYFFRMVEVLARAGQELGLSVEVAETLARKTLFGAGALLNQSGEDAGELRRRVTSPGGTTAAALEVMEQEGWEEVLARAVRRAAERSGELSAGLE